MKPENPYISVIIAAYQSQRTIAGTLEALRRQSEKNFEIIVVDSSPHQEVARIITESFPEVKYVHSEARLLPHAARNRGAALARGKVLVFSDPDVYPDQDWLESLIKRYGEEGDPVVGSLACHGRKWVDMGAHLVKFDKWLPIPRMTETDLAPTANFLCPYEAFERLGGFPSEFMLGDALFSWMLRKNGHRLLFCAEAVVRHHHTGRIRDNLRERRQRGYEYAKLRAETLWRRKGRLRMAWMLSILPLRWFKQTARSGKNSWRSGLFGDYIRVLPLVLAGHGAWLLGESRFHLERLLSRNGSI